MFSKVYDFSLDVPAILEVKAVIENTTPTHEFYMHNDTDRDDIIQDILMLKDLTCLESVQKLLNPIDCLLYTSPSPRDLSTARMPSSA